MELVDMVFKATGSPSHFSTITAPRTFSERCEDLCGALSTPSALPTFCLRLQAMFPRSRQSHRPSKPF